MARVKISSTSSLLEGSTYKGSKVTRVTSYPGWPDWRIIETADGQKHEIEKSKLITLVKKTTSGSSKGSSKLTQSSTSSMLKGLDYKGGKIKAVYMDPKGRDGYRTIEWTDGSTQSVNKSTVATLARIKGTLDYVAKFQSASPAEKKAMLEKSKERQHKMASSGNSTYAERKALVDRYHKVLKNVGDKSTYEQGEYTWITYKGRRIPIPKGYTSSGTKKVKKR